MTSTRPTAPRTWQLAALIAALISLLIIPASPALANTTVNQLITSVARCASQVDPTHAATWTIGDRGGWGATDMSADTVYISPDTPPDKVCDVVFHEWMHILQRRTYGDPGSAIEETNRALGTGGTTGVEEVADCGALLQGADWVYYGCASPEARRMASQLLLGWDTGVRAGARA